MGATYKGRPVGTFGEAGLFSLSRGKNITAVDGGIVVTNSRALAEAMDTPQGAEIGLKRQALLLLKAALLGILLHPRCYWLPLRLPFLRLGASVFDPDFPVAGLSPFQAGMGRAMLGRLGAINRARAEKAKTMLAELKAVTPETVPGAEPVFLRLPVLAGDASPAVCPELGMVRSYPLALDEIESLRPHVRGNVAVPGAKRLARSLMTLPTHGYVSRDDTRQIVRRVLG
jgi:dTDP-4-amino-4,6-dideoxygalactose transaminase